MCWETDKPPKPSDDPTDGGDGPVTDPDPPTTDEEPPVPCEELHFGPEDVSDLIAETIEDAPYPYEAWNNDYYWYSNFNIDISRLDCAITVTVRLKIDGVITPEQLGAWEDAIETKWNGKVSIICEDPECPGACPAGYSLYIDLLYVDADEHYVVTAQAPDATSGGVSGLNGTTSMTGWGVQDTVDITHEFGHMLGNTEEYFTTNGVDYTYGGTKLGFRDADGYIMNNPANDPRPENYDHIAAKVASLMGPGVTGRAEAL